MPLLKKGLENYNMLGLVFNQSTVTGALAHGSLKAPGNIDDENAAIELMDAGIHVCIVVGVGTAKEIEDCQTNKGACVSRSGLQSCATRHHGRK